jgi:hypothetical protein
MNIAANNETSPPTGDRGRGEQRQLGGQAMKLPNFPFSEKQVARATRLSTRQTAGKVVAVSTFGELQRFALQLISTRSGEPTVFVRDADGVEPGTDGLSLIVRQFNTVAEFVAAV